MLPEEESSGEFAVVEGCYTKVEAMRRVSDVWLAEDRILIATSFG